MKKESSAIANVYFGVSPVVTQRSEVKSRGFSRWTPAELGGTVLTLLLKQLRLSGSFLYFCEGALSIAPLVTFSLLAVSSLASSTNSYPGSCSETHYYHYVGKQGNERTQSP